MAKKKGQDYSGERELKKRTLERWGELKVERQSWVPHWRDVAEMCCPRLGNFFVNKPGKGEEINERIIDNTATRASNALRSMLMAFGSSPARKWIKFAPTDPELQKDHETLDWFADSTDRVLRVYSQSNTYPALHMGYGELVHFGTAADIVLDHYERAIHHYPLTIGQYAIDSDSEGTVCTLYREFKMTAGKMVQEFGLDAVSTKVRQAYEKGRLGEWFSVLHAIEPRGDRNPMMLDARNKRWRSCYVEIGCEEGHARVLRESGFDHFPALCPRWDLTTYEDNYGRSPVMDALADIRQLQDEQKCKGQNLQYAARPAMAVPTAAMAHASKIAPGALIPKDGDVKLEPLWTPDLGALQHQIASIEDDRRRIESTLYADMLLMFANGRRSDTTAREIDALDEEKFMMLGPIINRVTRELWEPLATITFERLLLSGGLKPMPRQMEGQSYGVEMQSVFAQAQRAIEGRATEKLITAAGALAQLNPDVRDKIDADRIIDALADRYGADPDNVVASEKAAVIRKARNDAMLAKEQAAAMESVAGTAQKLGATPVGGAQPSALDALTGYGGGV